MLSIVLKAGAGGVLYALAHVGFGLWPLIFIFLVPLWLALDRVTPSQYTMAGFAGAVFGFTFFASGFSWLFKLVDIFLGNNLLFGGLLWILYGLWFSLGFLGYAIVFHRLRSRQWPLVICATGPLLLLEWLQPHLFPPYAGAALIQVDSLVQIADLGGPLLLTAFVILMNTFFYQLWQYLQGNIDYPYRATAATVTLFLVVVSYGLARAKPVNISESNQQPLRVGIVQANLGVLEKRRHAIKAHRLHLDQTRQLLRQTALDLIVWPETAYGRSIRRPLPIDGQVIREEISTALLFGATSTWEDKGRRKASNSAFLVTRDGKITESYDKNHLIPLAEYLPLRQSLPDLELLFPHTKAFDAGTSTPPLHLGRIAISTPICYEVIKPDFVRKMVREANPQLLITLANDAWFGNTQQPKIHLAMTRLRAIEHRRWLIRATNSGISAIVSPNGRVIVESGQFTRENIHGVVYPQSSPTWYTKFGNWPGWLALVATVFSGLVTYRKSILPL